MPAKRAEGVTVEEGVLPLLRPSARDSPGGSANLQSAKEGDPGCPDTVKSDRGRAILLDGGKKPVSRPERPDKHPRLIPPGCSGRAPIKPHHKEAVLDLKEIRQIIDLMKRNDLSLFHLEREGFKIKLRKGVDFDAMPAPAPAPAAPAPASVPASAPAVPPVSGPAPAPAGTFIQSPMVGTFYRASGPGEKVFINVGDSVDENTTVCIIEAMKVMNEIKAEKRGVITRVMVEDATPVQYDSPLFEIQPA